jgi:dolichyl-phosphate beta-glucosyltransferase
VSDPFLSVVIPAFNEAARLPRTLERVTAFLRGFEHTSEIVVVDDGSTDGTDRLAGAHSSVTLVRNETNRGKGHSVRRGMLAARGQYRLMTDADLSTPIEELPRLLATLEAGYDVVIGSRALPGAAIEVRQSRFREGTGRVFNRLVQWLVMSGLEDTQCGFKLFTRDAAEEAFGAARLDGFCFDVEVLFIAKSRGLRIAEVPVIWRNDAATHVNAFRGGLAFLDIVRIRANALLGRYGALGSGKSREP